MPITNFTGGSNSGNNNSGGNSGNGPGGPGGLVPAMAAPPLRSSTDVPEYLIDYNEKFKDSNPAQYRDGVIDQAIAALVSMRKPNPLLVGSPGVGKTRVVEDIARRLANNDPSIPAAIQGYTIYEMPVAEFSAGMSYVGQKEERAMEVVKFFSDPKNKAICFVDEIHTLLTSHVLNETVQIFKSPLARGDMHVIGATTNTEIRFINDDPALARRFENVIVDELTIEQTVEVVKACAGEYIAHHNNTVIFDDEMAERLVTIASTTLPDGLHRPDNALTLLDRTMARTAMVAAKIAGNIATASGQSVSASMPTLRLSEDMISGTAKRIAHGDIEPPVFDKDAVIAAAKTEVLGQDHVIEEVVEDARKLSLNLFPSKKPMAYLFTGPSGVGKTSMANIIARQLTGQDALVINMTEFSSGISVSSLIGAADGYVGSNSRRELPFDPLLSNPYRLIIFDEIEKAHPDIHKLLLRPLDEGRLQNARGITYDFSRAIIVATTNAGREALESKSLGFGNSTQENSKLSNESLTKALQAHFTPEFLGRFTRMYGFNAISRELYREIIKNNYERERTRILNENPYVILPNVLSDDQITDLAKSYTANLGARPAAKAVRDFIEANAIV